jgi:hypothetical protein
MGAGGKEQRLVRSGDQANFAFTEKSYGNNAYNDMKIDLGSGGGTTAPRD